MLASQAVYSPPLVILAFPTVQPGSLISLSAGWRRMQVSDPPQVAS